MSNLILGENTSHKPNDRSIGDIIRRSFSLSEEQVQQILLHQQENSTRFGESAVALGFIKSSDVLWALSQQFEYPYSTPSGKEVSQELVLALNPFDDGAEVFRNLRSDVLATTFSAASKRRSLAIVSANVGEGKSFFAANLAVAFSQLGGRTLLIDADMRNPRQHQIFGVVESSGLSAVLSGRANEPTFVRPYESLPSLYLLPVGVTPPNPLELLQRGGFPLLLAEMQIKFDYVIIDTPAASHGADAKVIASNCGASLIIAKKNSTQVNAVNALSKSLKASGSNMIGVILNNH